MNRLLILFAHPALEKSRVQAALLRQVKGLEGVTFHDLYEAYPDFDIDVRREQEMLLKHDIIIWQHPFYWYSSPAIVKQWMDLVLEHGWAYGSEGNMLEGKRITNAISCGAPVMAYSTEGRNRFTIRQLLAPFDQTAFLCKMKYMPPFVVDGSHRLGREDIAKKSAQYRQVIQDLVAGKITDEDLGRVEFLNDLSPIPQNPQP
jgi:glutathione-regulated potassium-efflux system ancillary protein KefG